MPESILVGVSVLKSGGFAGLWDIANHPARTAIQTAVGHRLVDGCASGSFRPDTNLTRGELAQHQVLAGSLRRSLPFRGKPAASGRNPTRDAALCAYPEIVASPGAVRRDLAPNHTPVLPLQSGSFNAIGQVTRLDLAWALVQSLAMHKAFEALGAPRLTDPMQAIYRIGPTQAQRYDAGTGHCACWHREVLPKAPHCEPLHRTLLWMVCLNEAEEGGQTGFLYQQRSMQPRPGRMVIAPAYFTHTHRGRVPVSGARYILTSWVLLQRAEQLP